MMTHLSAPLYVDFNLTERCNYHCDFCYVPHHVEREMTVGEIDHALAQLAELNVLKLNISGGEPLIRTDILDILQVLQRYDFFYTFTTNASLVTQAIAEGMLRANIKAVGVSLDTANAEIFCLNRGSTMGFQQTVAGIRQLLEAGLKVGPAITLTRYNVAFVPKTLDFAASMGLGVASIQFICPGTVRAQQIMPTFQQWTDCILQLTELKRQNLLPLEVRFHPTNESPVPYELYIPLKEAGQLHALEEVWGITHEGVRVEEVSCAAGHFSCAIAANGDVYGCEMFLHYPELSQGNIFARPFKEIWAESFQRQQRLKKSELHAPCGQCEIDFCGGGCRAAAYFYTGNLQGADMRCPLALAAAQDTICNLPD